MSRPASGSATASVWRLLIHGAGDGAWNMAVDEAILDGYAFGEAMVAPTLRLYGWHPAALSLGRNQPAERASDRAWLRGAGVDLVRRPTGGRAVLHDEERTYAVIGRLDRPPFDEGVVKTYECIARALQAGLQRLGIVAHTAGSATPAANAAEADPACFASTGIHEITLAGNKLVGSAQLRRRSAFLQHGSLPIRLDAARLSLALGREAKVEGFTDLARELGGRPGEAALDAALREGFAESFGVVLQPGELGREESAHAQQLRCWKYDSAAWTLQGEVGARERHWAPPQLWRR